MTKDEAREIITGNYRAGLQRDNSGRGYICPVCGSGSGKHGTGMTENPRAPGRFTCWACGFTNASAFDLIAYEEGIISREEIGSTLTGEAIQKAYERYGISASDSPIKRTNEAKQTNYTKQANYTNKTNYTNMKQEKDFSQYYEECRARVSDPEAMHYLQGRGISEATIEKYGIGYDPKADPAESNHPTPRIIIPVTNGHYIARRIDSNPEFKALNNKNAVISIFNAALLEEDTSSPVFVVEGAFDALSIIEVGGEAISLNSAGNYKMLLKMLQERPTKRTLILSLDNDKAGRERERDLFKGLQENGVRCIQADIVSSYKDENERLQQDHDGLKADVQRAIRGAAKPDNVLDYMSGFMFDELESFSTNRLRHTGFTKLDKQMNGIYNGLYCLAATSSLGKTTFMHQIADQLAKAGEEVLYFSLEQSRLELLTKSLARTLYKIKYDDNSPSSLQLRTDADYEGIMIAAGIYYKEIVDRLSIIEGNFDFNIDSIVNYTKQYISDTGKKPVVIIDYLQIIKGSNDRKTIREQTDENITTLKRLSRNEQIPVFVISSINRMNYLNPIDFEALKESGGIEYSCDCVLGLQLQCIADDTIPAGKEFSNAKTDTAKREIIKREKRAIPRRVQLVCLKNRYGISNYEQSFIYDPVHDFFMET